jgi:hypothetical protein
MQLQRCANLPPSEGQFVFGGAVSVIPKRVSLLFGEIYKAKPLTGARKYSRMRSVVKRVRFTTFF